MIMDVRTNNIQRGEGQDGEMERQTIKENEGTEKDT